ncbi:UbiA prenyltransferase family-domain-containing protein [Vararia minispora EC-137]|uniref:UbiA prenyltransferase family-domain-containing protein n=1 Tax=Vararia minispora EC-137 TaxID=1314806 RepID=A0ACB8QIG8_9AGAM|nr:UbiA prenyltransferase family-domain-containing protein [Vararia minispora EC-137]
MELPAAGLSSPLPASLGLATKVAYAVESLPEIFFLFTKSDLKTILIPATIFACLSAPEVRLQRVLSSMWWTWLHLLQFCVSNQSLSPEEDALNKPWRPIPSGNISVATARNLRWILLPSCLLQSFVYGVPWQGLSLAIVFLAHNEWALGSHWVLRTLCNAWGYASFNAGAAAIVSSWPGHTLQARTVLSFCCNAAIILTTIHAQDFRDEVGDKRLGRMTLPIAFSQASRITIWVFLLSWSLGLSIFCATNYILAAAFCTLAMIVGARFYFWRDVEADQRSYLYYNVWLACAQVVHTPVVMALLRRS